MSFRFFCGGWTILKKDLIAVDDAPAKLIIDLSINQKNFIDFRVDKCLFV